MPIGPSGGSSSGGGMTALYDSGYLVGDQANIDSGANGIAGTFFALYIVGYFRSAAAATSDNVLLTFNNDSSAIYDSNRLQNANTTVTGLAQVAQTTGNAGNCPAASAAANVFGPLRGDIPAYSGTTNFKTGTFYTGSADTTAANQVLDLNIVSYRSATAITRIKVACGSGNIKAGSRFIVFGVGTPT